MSQKLAVTRPQQAMREIPEQRDIFLKANMTRSKLREKSGDDDDVFFLSFHLKPSAST